MFARSHRIMLNRLHETWTAFEQRFTWCLFSLVKRKRGITRMDRSPHLNIISLQAHMEERHADGDSASTRFRLPVESLQYISEHAPLYPFDEDPFRHSRSLDASRPAPLEGYHYQPSRSRGFP